MSSMEREIVFTNDLERVHFKEAAVDFSARLQNKAI